MTVFVHTVRYSCVRMQHGRRMVSVKCPRNECAYRCGVWSWMATTKTTTKTRANVLIALEMPKYLPGLLYFIRGTIAQSARDLRNILKMTVPTICMAMPSCALFQEPNVEELNFTCRAIVLIRQAPLGRRVQFYVPFTRADCRRGLRWLDGGQADTLRIINACLTDNFLTKHCALLLRMERGHNTDKNQTFHG